VFLVSADKYVFLGRSRDTAAAFVGRFCASVPWPVHVLAAACDLTGVEFAKMLRALQPARVRGRWFRADHPAVLAVRRLHRLREFRPPFAPIRRAARKVCGGPGTTPYRLRVGRFVRYGHCKNPALAAVAWQARCPVRLHLTTNPPEDLPADGAWHEKDEGSQQDTI
jgi:hypothetical protein